MDEPVLLGSRSYIVFLLILMVARGADFLSTWVATPNLILEANPIAKRLRWRWGIILNVTLCFAFAFWPLPAIIISTTSALVAARNFQTAWLMRAAGEEKYRLWVLEHLEATPLGLFMFCLVAQTFLVGGVGTILIYFAEFQMVPLGIGLGLIAYALTILIFTTISLWRNRQALR